MVEFLIKRPIAVFMTFLAFVLLGITSANLMPVSLMPEIDVPYLKVQIDEPMYSSQELEKRVVQPIRRQLLQVSKLKDIQSSSFHGKAFIDLYFEYGTDIDYAFIDVNEKMDRILSSLPNEVERPKLIRSNPSDIPLCYIHLPYPKNSTAIDFSNYIKNIVRKRLEQFESVAFVDITGTISPEIHIQLDYDKLAQLDLTSTRVENSIRQNNTQVGSFKIKNGHYVYDVLFEPSLQTVEDIEKLYINTESTRIQLRDVAKVSLSTQEKKGVFRSQGQNAISLAVIGKADTKVSKVKRDVLSYLNELQHENPSITYTIQQDQSELLNIAISNLQTSLIVGAILAILIVYLFIRNYKVSLIIALVIPFSVIISFLFLYLLGISFNIVSLSGLIVGIGMMIDNSIIVIDNITQYRIKGYSVIKSCVYGTYEILRPLLSSLLTTCAVFIPLIYLSGISGILFFDQALAIVISLSVSYVVSIILLPTLYVAFKIELKKTYKKLLLFNIYKQSFNRIFQLKTLVQVGALTLVLIGGIVFMKSEKEKLPEIRYNDFNVLLQWNENISIEQSAQRIKKIEVQLQNTNYSTYIGEQDFITSKQQELHTGVQIYVNTTTHKAAETVKKQLRNYIAQQFPKATVEIQKTENVFEQLFTANEPNLYLKIPLERADELSSISEKITSSFPEAYVDVTRQKQVLTLKIDLRKLATYKIDYSDLIRKLQSLFNSKEISILKSTNEYVPIVIEKATADFSTVINKSYIANQENNRIPIANLLSVQKTTDFEILYADADANYIPLNITTDNPTAVIDFVQKNIASESSFGGTFFEEQTFVNELLIIIFIVILLLYFVLAAQFESLIQPLIILCEIPLTIGATLLAMYFFGISLNIMSMIGIIIMLGIVINDSILKIDTINKLKKLNNKSLLEAIHEAGRRRLQAILMTSLTTILAMIPVLFTTGIGADLQKPLSYVVIIAMCIGTFVSIYIVPIMYWLFTKHTAS